MDHIFPVNLAGQGQDYREAVDVLWNFQPVPAEVNNYKRARHPQEFFKSADGSKYIGSYDFIVEATSDLWNNHIDFLANRKQKMLAELNKLYGLTLVNPQKPAGLHFG